MENTTNPLPTQLIELSGQQTTLLVSLLMKEARTVKGEVLRSEAAARGTNKPAEKSESRHWANLRRRYAVTVLDTILAINPPTHVKFIAQHGTPGTWR